LVALAFSFYRRPHVLPRPPLMRPLLCSWRGQVLPRPCPCCLHRLHRVLGEGASMFLAFSFYRRPNVLPRPPLMPPLLCYWRGCFHGPVHAASTPSSARVLRQFWRSASIVVHGCFHAPG
jgi:hypothetical protein